MSYQPPNAALAFNFASQALNHSFFLDHLVRTPALQLLLYTNGPFRRNHQPPIIQDISPELIGLIYQSFDDLEGIKLYMSAAALGMTESGWAWLVDMTIRSLAVATYGPGTMLVESRQHRYPNGIDEVDLLPHTVSSWENRGLCRVQRRAQVPNTRSEVWTYHRPVPLLV